MTGISELPPNQASNEVDVGAMVCACGCRRAIVGRRSKRFYSDACRVRAHRGARPTAAEVAENPLQRGQVIRRDGGVTLTRDVHCRGCGSVLSKIRGPLPVAAYCRKCAPTDGHI